MKKLLLIALSAALLLSGSLVAAATLQMRDGRLVRGKYLGGTAGSVNMLIAGKIETFPVPEILLVDFSATEPAATTPAPPPPPAEPPPEPVAPETPPGDVTMLPAGTAIQVRMISSIDSRTNKVGDKFEASLDQPLVFNGQLLAARGTTAYGRLTESKQASGIEGRSELRLELTGLVIDGRVMPIVTSDYDVAGASRGKQTAKRTGVGAGIGAVIGAIAGGGEGAAIGAGIGGGAGAASQVITHGEGLHIPSETLLVFTLAEPAAINVSPGAAQ
ncbi:MAG: YMGG-like glycine zipper-containing protein [Terriglobia bacterium]